VPAQLLRRQGPPARRAVILLSREWRPRDGNNFLLDGVYNVIQKLNTFGVRPPVDAIRDDSRYAHSSYDAAFVAIRRASERRSQVGNN